MPVNTPNFLKTVILEIRFPILLYVEQRMGNLQIKIMDKLPNVSEIQEQKFLIFSQREKSDGGDKIPLQEETPRKMWKFESNDKTLSMTASKNNLVIETNTYDSYVSFKESVKDILDKYFEVMQIPVLTRIGFRYINQIDITTMNETNFKRKFKSNFPLSTFNLDDSEEYQLFVLHKFGELKLRYIETIGLDEKNNRTFTLDLDGISFNKDVEQRIQEMDKIHSLIRERYLIFLRRRGD